MIKNLNNSFSSRLLLGIFSIAITLLFTLLYYTFIHSKTLMIKHLHDTEQQTLEHISTNIELDMKQLSNEIKFLTKLSVMNDIIADDMDSRILKLLEAKKVTSKFKIDFSVKKQDGKKVLATSNEIFNIKKGILFEKQINSLFQNKKVLGILQLYLPLKELNLYLNNHPKFSLIMESNKAIKNKNELYYLSKELDLPTGQILTLARPILKGELHTQLVPLKSNLILLGLFILIFIFILAYFISLRISKPILDLSKLMKKVSSQKAYHLRSNINRNDEIGILSQSFNELLHIIQQNISHIQEESQDRMRQFTDLVESFSKITQQKNSQKINAVLNEVKILAKQHQTPSESFLSSLETLAKLQHQRIKLEETQVKLLEEATHLAQNRSHFITQISHEFKTPLNSIIGFSQVIEHEQLLNPPYDKMAINIEKSGKHLLLLVNQVLNVASQNHNNEQVILSDFSLNLLIQEVIETLEIQANKMHLSIVYNKSDTINISSDERMVRQALINLIANSIKFSNHKDIFITIKKVDHGFNIHVKDQGIGMEQKAMQSLFAPFVRLSNALEIKGTGLGLALAQSYMRKLGGDIVAHSKGLNHGSEFIIKVEQ